MIGAMLRVMAMGLMRDRGALVMAFILPPMIFVIFAAIFSGTSGDAISLQVAYGVAQADATSERFETALRNEPTLRVLPERYASEQQVVDAVNFGRADVGLFVRSGFTDTAVTPIAVLVDPGKAIAGAMLSAQVQALIGNSMPDLAISRLAPSIENLVGGFTPEQSARLAAATAEMAGGSDDAQATQPDLVGPVTIGGDGGTGATVTYYAGAVAILFLLFSAMQSAATLIEERNSGVLDRIAVGPAGTDVVVLGKALFLTVQGLIQVSLIFLVAWALYQVDFLAHFWVWLLTTVCAAAAAAGLGLAVAACCTTRQQAQTISTFVVLVCSAIGGSMVPRFMMPPWLQDVGWYTPNAWAIEAYQGALWRGEALGTLWPQLVWLVVLAVSGTAIALAMSRMRLRF
jgi:ABC-2 type transport system permease protein